MLSFLNKIKIGVVPRKLSMTSSYTSVACLIIGDEVLNGKTLDTNSNWLAKKCFDSGFSLKKIVVIPDEEKEIIDSVKYLSSKFDLVFTSGGIGSTHDDITYASLSKAFNLPLQLHDETLVRMKQISEKRLESEYIASGKPMSDYKNTFSITESRKIMARLPSGNKVKVLFPAKALWVPLVVVNNNVHILPGIPRLFKDMLEGYFSDTLVPSLPDAKRFYRKLVGTMMYESDMADNLTEIQKEADKFGIKIGSYPKWKPDNVKAEYWKIRVVVSILGQNDKDVGMFAEMVKESIDGFAVESD